ncbi:MAG: FRG domain-containing protein [Deltaproteobacteria bacterium]|nr:FRG domain-containing protein [Deltaproteobacteria bacterium]
MSRKSKWCKPKVEDGFGQVQFSSWKRFYEYLNEEMHEHGSCIWRGQRCDNWRAKSTFDRLFKKLDHRDMRSSAFKQSHLERIQFASRGRRGSNPPELEENQWWALGQHHGLATPLLDWTTSPFVAAFFAFAELGEKQTSHRAIYALNKPLVEEKGRELFDPVEETWVGLTASRGVEFIKPMSNENQSLIAQGGEFTKTPINTDLEYWVKSWFQGEETYILLRLLVPDKDRKECLRALNRMNINHLSLFPDLYGASKYCNLFAEIENY